MPRNWQGVVAGMTDVQKLVHLAMRLSDDEIDRIRGELLREGRASYENELTMQARRVGCRNRTGRLTTGPALSELNRLYEEHARSIVNTYNYDLAGAIVAIGAELPTANRNTYAARLRGWEGRRNAWKLPQIAQMTDGYARAMAQSDFHINNGIIGYAILQPIKAVCPVCMGWVARGEVPMREALNNPPPYHGFCPHLWRTYPDKASAGQCADLWMGE